MKPSPQSVPVILFLLDPELSKAKTHQLMKTVHLLRRIAHIELLRGEISQTETISKMLSKKVDLVYLPWKKYFEWRNLEAKAGGTRTGKPLIAGYFADELPLSELGSNHEIYRLTLLDFNRLRPSQVSLVTQTLLDPALRTGIRPLVHSMSKIYTEKLTQKEGLGFRLDVIQDLTELKKQCWRERRGSVRDTIIALWELFFEKGPGRSDFAVVTQKKPFLASLDITADDHCLAFKLQFVDRSWKQRSQVRGFWPAPQEAENPMHRLFRASDMIRVHTAVDTSEIEITVCLFNEYSTAVKPGVMKSMILEPISSKQFSELQSDLPGAERPELELLPAIPKPPLSARTLEASLQVKERMLKDASQKLRAIRQELTLRDQLLAEIKRHAGPQMIRVPKSLDAESLIDVLRDKISSVQQEIAMLEQSPTTPENSSHLDKMTQMESTWIQALHRMVQTLDQSRPKTKVRLPKAS